MKADIDGILKTWNVTTRASGINALERSSEFIESPDATIEEAKAILKLQTQAILGLILYVDAALKRIEELEADRASN